ncbi:hypothetical protein ACUSIJ_27015 [Pseudochelatococcus sp. B33]
MPKDGIVGLNLAKNVFQPHGADAPGAIPSAQKPRRHPVVEFLACRATRAAGNANGSGRFSGRKIHMTGIPIPGRLLVSVTVDGLASAQEDQRKSCHS